MIKPKLCLALSVSLALVQANIIECGNSTPGNQDQSVSTSKSVSRHRKGIHLFLLSPKGSELYSQQLVNAPAAVLTIHPSIEIADKKLCWPST